MKILAGQCFRFVFAVSIFGNRQGVNSWNLAIVVDAPWEELRDFSKAISKLESVEPIRVYRYNLLEEADWQVCARCSKLQILSHLLEIHACCFAEALGRVAILYIPDNSWQRVLEWPLCKCTNPSRHFNNFDSRTASSFSRSVMHWPSTFVAGRPTGQMSCPYVDPKRIPPPKQLCPVPPSARSSQPWTCSSSKQASPLESWQRPASATAAAAAAAGR